MLFFGVKQILNNLNIKNPDNKPCVIIPDILPRDVVPIATTKNE